MIDKTTKIQYEIMTVENENGDYIPSFDKLIAEAPNSEMAKKWEECRDLIERTKDSDFSFDGFAFKFVACVKQACGHYEILQHPYNAEYEDIEDVLESFAEENRKCTRCICG